LPELLPELGLIAHQDNADVELLRRLDGAFDRRARPMVPAHRIDCDFHVTSRGIRALRFLDSDDLIALIRAAIQAGLVRRLRFVALRTHGQIGRSGFLSPPLRPPHVAP
jgi:hypothetical protein